MPSVIKGRWIDLIPGGDKRRVLWEERKVYVEAAVRVRLGECDAEIEAIKSGFTTVVPALVLPLLTWRDLEAKVCATPIIDCVAVCCSVLQCVAVCCSVLQCP